MPFLSPLTIPGINCHQRTSRSTSVALGWKLLIAANLLNFDVISAGAAHVLSIDKKKWKKNRFQLFFWKIMTKIEFLETVTFRCKKREWKDKDKQTENLTGEHSDWVWEWSRYNSKVELCLLFFVSVLSPNAVHAIARIASLLKIVNFQFSSIIMSQSLYTLV